MGTASPWNEEGKTEFKVEKPPRERIASFADASSALDILTGYRPETNQASLCVCCVHQGHSTCPYESAKTGICPGYELDQTDPVSTETRIMAYQASFQLKLKPV
jgi:hypothetical protein